MFELTNGGRRDVDAAFAAGETQKRPGLSRREKTLFCGIERQAAVRQKGAQTGNVTVPLFLRVREQDDIVGIAGVRDASLAEMRVQVFQIKIGVECGKGRAGHDAFAFRHLPAVLQHEGLFQQAAEEGERLRVIREGLFQ